ncbi:hypothetical protein [Clostridium intestinale]|uniref:hypothetical protein n=1 Tax=Clostridium intestinale TaxID=36845 RepID=UPI001114B0F2|nr:hypothetical protein [Clostridium intestinale]
MQLKFFIPLLIVLNLSVTPVPANSPRQTGSDDIINAYVLAYEAMYTGDNEKRRDYIILDLESVYFTDTTYEQRQQAIEYFKKFNKPVLSASLFKLQEIGLADKRGEINKISADLLMITCAQPYTDGMIIEGYKWTGPIAAYQYKIYLKFIDNKWKIEKVDLLGIS